ncbi:MAG: hypothetical protein LBG76_00660 [Treponema sp.]|jgi:ESS family glutamate:Na+ symporter|nr:hypothetical protein [Treponema sp.]
MNSAILTQLFYSFCVLSVLLIIGVFLRSVLKIFQKLFLPASVIGGVIGLLAGPVLWDGGGIPFPPEWLAAWSALPGLLIIPVIAAVPLGMRYGKGGPGQASVNAIKMFALLFAIGGVQILLGLAVREIFTRLMPDLELYKTFGYELTEGFAGGHGTAGFIGGYYRDLGLPYWESAQGLTATTATFGLVGGMIIGIAAINIAARTGKTALLKKPEELPPELFRGYETDQEKQKSLGRETTFSSSIETISFHLAIVLSVCGGAYGVMNLVRKYHTPILYQLPVWVYALLLMFAVNGVIQKTGLRRLIDVKVKSRISGVFTDYAITASIASLSIQAVFRYAVPLMVLIVLGFVFTYIAVFGLAKRAFADCWFERGLCVWGTYTGVFFTGLMLLKICDRDYQLPALNDYSTGYSMTTLFGFILTPVTVGLMLNYGLLVNVLVQGGILALSVILLFCAGIVSKRAAD